MNHYRQEIDGLRALAVTSVILYHAGLAQLPGGFIGVDVFFVISGYLITSLIVKGLNEGSFSLVDFYKRRARRILPALFLVLACTVPFAWIWMLPEDFRNYAQSMTASVFSYSNIHFWLEKDYFAQDANLVPLLHTWSLAVEEQYYLIFPLLMLIAWPRLSKRAVVGMLAGIAAASLATSLWWAASHPTASFFLLPSRAWELMAGALASFVPASRDQARNNALSLGAATILVASFFLLDDQDGWSPLAAVIPVVATAGILVFGVRGTLLARILSVQPFLLIGKISYSAYLWHQPIMVFARIRSPEEPALSTMLALGALSFLLAYFSWRYVEEPLRRSHGQRVVGWRPLVSGLGLTVVLLASLGLTGQITHGLPSRLPEAVVAMERQSDWSRNCMFTQEGGMPAFPITRCLFNEKHPTRYAIWGDSIASSISPALADALDRKGIALQQLTHGFCAPLLNVYRDDLPGAVSCDAFNDQAMEQLLTSGVNTVILAASWQKFLDDDGYVLDGKEKRIANRDRGFLVTQLSDTIQKLEKAGIRVVLVFGHPTTKMDVTDSIAQLMLKGIPRPSFTITYEEFVAASMNSRGILEKAASPTTLKVQTEDGFCNERKDGLCTLASNGVAFLSDGLHFTKAGARIVVDQIMRKLYPSQVQHLQGASGLGS
ncbi:MULTISPECIES: acyltransferase family protein [unclassified Rhizobium]|uniref:acyltransferase family protein n=1 Tax=unclassified Rhizobium TaxID=2613769 RepID=UPI0009E6643F|nr:MULTISPECIES: acyltransferase family protein [unclassified Rhizobium]